MQAVKNALVFGQHQFDASTTGEKDTVPVAMRPTLGPLSMLQYKTARLRWSIEGAGAAEGNLALKADGTTLANEDISAGSGAVDVDLAGVQGQTPLELVADVTTAGDAGATVQAVLDVEQPLIMSGCA